MRRASDWQRRCARPRYFFDPTMDEELYPDTVGMNCSDTLAARREALNALSRMMRDAIRTAENERDLHMDVRNTDRRIVFIASVGLSVRWLGWRPLRSRARAHQQERATRQERQGDPERSSHVTIRSPPDRSILTADPFATARTTALMSGYAARRRADISKDQCPYGQDARNLRDDWLSGFRSGRTAAALNRVDIERDRRRDG